MLNHTPIVYGIRSPSNDAPWTKELNGVLDIWAKINEFGATPPIDIFPVLKWVPQRFLNNWVTRTKVVHDKLHELYDKLLRSVETRRNAIGPMHCIADRVLDQNGDNTLSRHNVMFLAGVALKGGSDTTASTLATFVQAMIAFPEVQRKAHAELDTVIGGSRIPDWKDYPALPYVAAVVKETMRWRPTAPLGVPHALSEGLFPSRSQHHECLLTAGRSVDRRQISSERYSGLCQCLGTAPRREEVSKLARLRP